MDEKGISDNPMAGRELRNKICFYYKDSSAPPQWHRSYEIAVTEKEIGIKVNCYGTLLNDRKYPIDKEDFDRLGDFIGSLGLHDDKYYLTPEELEETAGACGVSSYKLQVGREREHCKELSWDYNSWLYCKDSSERKKKITDMQEKWELLEKEIKRMIPDVEEVIRSTKEFRDKYLN